jgi:ribosomal protein S21
LSEVIISDGESVERALRTFKKKVDRAGILKDLRNAPRAAPGRPERRPQGG